MEITEQLVRWYNIEYIKPDKEGFYIIYNNYCNSNFLEVSIGLWDDITKRFINHETERAIPGVTHWMPMPDPPCKN